MDKNLIMNEKYYSLPTPIQKEVADFIDYLSIKYRGNKKTLPPNRTSNKKKKRKSYFGIAKDLIIIKEDFDTPIDEFKDYM